MAASPVLSVVVATSIAFGLRNALDGPKDETPIVRERGDEPDGDDGLVALHFEWGKPEDTWVVVRPWTR